MVEPKRLPLALAILKREAIRRESQGKSTEFKWLLSANDSGLKEQVESGQRESKKTGEYQKLGPTDPRIALYSDTPQEIQDILSSLARDPQWHTIEEARAGAFVGNAPRRPGTNSFVDSSRREWRSLNFNNKPGYSEAEAKIPTWRKDKIGTPTGISRAR
jgi:hypothetical protein